MRTIEEVIKENKKANNGYVSCDLSNFMGCCSQIKKALQQNELEKATDEMCAFTSIFDGVVDINYDKYRIDTGSVYDRRFKAPSKEIIQNDFKKAKEEIENFICENYKDGEFEITKEVLFELPFWCVDWRWYNNTSRRFIDACKVANKLVGYTKDDEISSYYSEPSEKERWGFEEIFYSSYNGGRVVASFKDCGDCLMWSYHGEANKESDGLYWAEQPAY